LGRISALLRRQVVYFFTHVHKVLGVSGTVHLFDRLGLGAWNGLDQTQQHLGTGNIGKIFFTVRRFQFQSVTFCNRLASFLVQACSSKPSSSFWQLENQAVAEAPE